MRYGNIVLGSAVAMALLAIYCMAGEMDYQDAKLEEKSSAIEYCWRVKAGVQRDWKTDINCAEPVQVAGVDDAGI